VSELLRQYEIVMPDGYPWQWHFSGLGKPAIKDLIREEADHRCLRCGHPYRKGEHGTGEWSPCDGRCSHGGPFKTTAPDGVPSTQTDNALRLLEEGWLVYAQWRILTVHHLDEDKANCRWWNLAALCQRCHLRMQRAVVMSRPYHYEHSPWFRPFAAGFYAFKYLNEDLTRQETMARLDELLALEHLWIQDALTY